MFDERMDTFFLQKGNEIEVISNILQMTLG